MKFSKEQRICKALRELKELYKEQAAYWEGQERKWKGAREFCHQKVLEIQTMRQRFAEWKERSKTPLS